RNPGGDPLSLVAETRDKTRPLPPPSSPPHRPHSSARRHPPAPPPPRPFAQPAPGLPRHTPRPHPAGPPRPPTRRSARTGRAPSRTRPQARRRRPTRRSRPLPDQRQVAVGGERGEPRAGEVGEAFEHDIALLAAREELAVECEQVVKLERALQLAEHLPLQAL